jgi:Putative Flp pilus-assembly TadE/G-like
MSSTTPQVRIVARRPRRSERDEQGYIAVVTALVMTVLLMIIGIAVDFASWYARSSTLQRVTDAAALAGVTAAPNRANEILIAEESLAKNGIKNGVNGITVTTTIEPGSSNRLRVTVTDRNVQGFFTSWFRAAPVIERTSAAEYIQKISLGSALNAIGTGNLPDMTPTGTTQDFWLAVSGNCTAKEDGDRLLAASDGNRKKDSDDYVCNHSSTPHPDASNAHINSDYDPAGYTYYATLPCPGTEVDGACPPVTSRTVDPITLEVFDPWYSPNSDDPTDFRLDRKALSGPAHPAWNSTEVETTFAIYAPDTTPDDFSDDNLSLIGTPTTFPSCQDASCVGGNPWVGLTTIPAGRPGGRYRIQVFTKQAQPNSFGHNVFALRAKVGSTFTLCSTVVSATCPSVAGDESMSVFANKSGGVAEMYLAKLAPASDYRGKRVRILLWDPGEGAKQIQILPPGSSTPVMFSHRTWDPGLKLIDGTRLEDKAEGWATRLTTDTLQVGTAVPIQDPLLAYPQWNLNSRYSPSKYNDRMVAIEVNVPRDYGYTGGVPTPLPDNGWWKIRYISDTGIVQDRTTWSVSLAGDPVHLVDGD